MRALRRDGCFGRSAQMAPFETARRAATALVRPPAVLAPGAAHRVMTGAALPEGADAVVMQEQATLQ